MGGCHWFVTSRHQQSQPLGIIAGSLHLYGAAFHGAGLRTVGAAAYCIIKFGQAEITLVIGAGKPFRRDAANTLAARHVNAKATRNRSLVLGQGHQGHRSFSLCGWVKAQRCAATLPVGETGGARCKGGRDGGGSPGLHKPRTWSGARKVGETVPDERQRSLAPRGGSAPSKPHPARAPAEAGQKDLIRMCKPQNLTSDHPDRRIPDRRRGHEHDEAPLVSGAPRLVWLNRRCGETR